MFTKTLILNQMYKPHEIIDWKEATTRMFCGKIEILAQYDEVLAHIDRQTLQTFPELKAALRMVIGVDAEDLTIKVPAVAVLRRRVGMIKNGVKFSKTNMCLRDDYTCQYCGARLPVQKLNYDHVRPRAQGGKTDWGNIVMSCVPCNSRKANRTPDQANMPLLSVPMKPSVLPMSEPQMPNPDQIPEEWVPFLPQVAA